MQENRVCELRIKWFRSVQSRRIRRSTRLIDFGCDSHMTGVAAAALSVFLRENIEHPFDLKT